MTPAATPEALVEKLARDLAREGGWNDPDAPWTENQVIIARGGAGEPVWRDFVDDARSLLGRETLTTLLAALATATAEAASLRAEVAAKDRALKIADEALAPFSRCAEVGLPYSFTGADFVAAHEARTALARAATAGEGRSDG